MEKERGEKGGKERAELGNVSNFPVKLWGLDPLYTSYVKMFIGQLLALEVFAAFPSYTRLYGHPISGVEVMGYVVGRKIWKSAVSFVLDDGTGVVRCQCWFNNRQACQSMGVAVQDNMVNSSDGAQIGDLVSIKGSLAFFRNQREISINHGKVEKDANSEFLFWLEVIHRTKDVYQAPSEITKVPFAGSCAPRHDFAYQQSQTPMFRVLLDHFRREETIRFSTAQLLSSASLISQALFWVPENTQVEENMLQSSSATPNQTPNELNNSNVATGPNGNTSDEEGQSRSPIKVRDRTRDRRIQAGLLVRNTIHELVSVGKVVPVKGWRDVFEVLSAKTLSKTIAITMRTKEATCKSATSAAQPQMLASRGVPFAILLECVRKSYPQVSASTLRDALSWMKRSTYCDKRKLARVVCNSKSDCWSEVETNQPTESSLH